MANNVVGFIGIENYEIILYLSRILAKLGKRVLLVDYSESSDLTSCIPVPIDLNPQKDVISYMGIDFTGNKFITEFIDSYDDILINFGFHMNSGVTLCTQIGYVVDQQKFHIERLVSLPKTEISNISLLIKDYVDSKINSEYILERLNKNIRKDNIYVFEQDVIDTKFKILAQYNTVFEFKRISRGTKGYLKNTILSMHPGMKTSTIQKAYKLAERGH